VTAGVTLPVRTRRARPSDAATIARTMELGVATYAAFASAWTTTRMHVPSLTAQLARRDTWALLAEIAGEPAGHVALYPDQQPGGGVYLFALFVRPPWWGTGLAAGLHEAFVAEARARGYGDARLHTPAAHARARRFYERRGWRLGAGPESWNGLPVVEYRCRISP
jgi:GNAT superfamily N-acetyltransferase